MSPILLLVSFYENRVKNHPKRWPFPASKIIATLGLCHGHTARQQAGQQAGRHNINHFKDACSSRAVKTKQKADQCWRTARVKGELMNKNQTYHHNCKTNDEEQRQKENANIFKVCGHTDQHAYYRMSRGNDFLWPSLKCHVIFLVQVNDVMIQHASAQ